jgi:hypothetical protein
MIKKLLEIQADRREEVLAAVARIKPVGGLVIIDDNGCIWNGTKFVDLQSDPKQPIRVFEDDGKAKAFCQRLNDEGGLKRKRGLTGRAVLAVFVPDDEIYADLRELLEEACA